MIADHPVLLCFNTCERELFFSGSPPLPFDAKWVTCASSAELVAEIHKTKPAILVSCWSTPAIPRDVIDHPEFKVNYVCHLTGAVRTIIPRYFIEKGGIVTNWGGIAAPQVAEHALLLALASLRNMTVWRPFICRNPETRGDASHRLQTMTLQGKRVGIHGYGAIARALIKLLKPFEVDISVYSECVPEMVFSRDGIKSTGSLKELFRNREVLFECEALTPGSRGSVTAEILAGLNDGSVFINVGRGLVVDEAALLEEAVPGRLRVGLDVMVDEPADENSKWLDIPGVVLSPHIGGLTSDRYIACRDHAIMNIQNHIKGYPVVDRIDLDIYDRMT
jgi:phosphoglycerate dehydrogenase-like enzyme